MSKKTLSLLAAGDLSMWAPPAAGDLCMWAPLDDIIGSGDEETIFSEVKPLFDSTDIRLINLENPLTDTGTPIPKSGPNIRGPEAGVSIITAGGFDCAILANNHIGDFGPEGVIRTLKTLENHGIGYVGAGATLDEARKPWIVKKNGKALAVIATAENEFGGATDNLPGSNAFNLRRICEDIISARNQADFVLVVMHGGNELNPVPSPVVVDRYRTFVDAGADAVIGMHPHCPQGFEIYNNRPIVYSTGNFLFCNKSITDAYDSWYYGYIPRIVFGGAYPEMTIHPYRFTFDGRHIKLLDKEEKAKVMAYLDRISAVITDKTALKNHYEGWVALEASKLLYTLYHKPEIPIKPDGTSGQLTDLPSLAMRNVLTCEAHNDMVKSYIKILCDGRLDECRQFIPAVRELQKIK